MAQKTFRFFNRCNFLFEPSPLESDVRLKRSGLALNPRNFTLSSDFKAEVLASECLGFHLTSLGSFSLPNLSQLGEACTMASLGYGLDCPGDLHLRVVCEFSSFCASLCH